MDNIILSGMLKEFSERHEIADEKLDRQFEKFANYCLLKTDHYDSFEFEKVGTDDSIGVDGVAIAIGGVIVNEVDDAQQLTKGQFDAQFYFTQAKTSVKFDLGDFLKFVNTVKVFFGSERQALPHQLQEAFAIKQMIYERASKLRELPSVALAYVYAGRFDLDGSGLRAQIETQIGELRDMPYLFSKVVWYVHDGDAIARLYREAQNETQRDISFQRHVALPAISGANAAYLGVVGCKDYVKMIQKEDGELNRGLFFENVRDFLGAKNTVNEEIAKTIANVEERDRFAILNNGVTIVAKKVTPSGDNFRLSQFQVVNGCQTSHVLYNGRAGLTDDMYITVKIIETSDVDLSGKVIATTNSQSHVTKEAFATIRPYHRTLEDFFNAMRSVGYSYYYERRPHQYDDRGELRQQQIVSAPSLIKSFVSVVLEEPHKVHYYYGNLLLEYNKNRSSELFSEDDYPGLYFAGHHIATLARAAANRNRDHANWAYQLALLAKRQIAPELRKGAHLNDKNFLDVLKRIDRTFEDAFKSAANVLKDLKLRSNQNRMPDATRALVSAQARSLKQPIEMPPRVASPASTAARPPMIDGLYVCIVESIDPERKRAYVRYGPFSIEARVDVGAIPILQIGRRLPFKVTNGEATVYRPNHK